MHFKKIAHDTWSYIVYIEVPSKVSPPSSVVGLPMLSNHPSSKLIEDLYI